MFVRLVQANDLTMPQTQDQEMDLMPSPVYNSAPVSSGWPKPHNEISNSEKPVILPSSKEEYDTVEVLEEHFSLHDMEKEMILKALKKFNGKRKEASDELGISERTLYRKIKQFNIDI
ncbi:MAG: hypothetical protein IPH93_01475 [Saprospiraceae bacterium]|nr:hypothetical protein [Saprospiraceae bacterium]